MRIFRLTANDGSVTVIARAQCSGCARLLAAQRVERVDSRLWTNRTMSRVEMFDYGCSDFDEDGRAEILSVKFKD